MIDQPLQPFVLPSALLKYLPTNGLSVGLAAEWILYAVFAFWAVYTLVAIYHWLTYSHGSWLTYPSIAIHLFMSIALMGYALSGNYLP